MAKQKVRATRHNGRKGENGVFKAGHNDRSFDVDAAEHIDSSRSLMNVYWDMYQGYTTNEDNSRTYRTADYQTGYYEQPKRNTHWVKALAKGLPIDFQFHFSPS